MLNYILLPQYLIIKLNKLSSCFWYILHWLNLPSNDFLTYSYKCCMYVPCGSSSHTTGEVVLPSTSGVKLSIKIWGFGNINNEVFGSRLLLVSFMPARCHTRMQQKKSLCWRRWWRSCFSSSKSECQLLKATGIQHTSPHSHANPHTANVVTFSRFLSCQTCRALRSCWERP